VTQQADEPNDIGRNFLLGNRKKIAKFLMRTLLAALPSSMAGGVINHHIF
jgi:hypothetical protein